MSSTSKTFGKRTWIPLCAIAGTLAAQPLQIISPASGTRVNPGETITINVNVSDAFRTVMILESNSIGPSATLSSPPYQFLVQIPWKTPPGLYSLTAGGFPASGPMVRSAPMTVDVERPDAPVTLKAGPSSIHFLTVDQKGFISVVGTFADGTTTNLTKSTLTTYSAGGVVKVGAFGEVNATTFGEDTIRITYSGLSASIPVTIDPPLRIFPSQIVMYPGQKRTFTAAPVGSGKPPIAWSIEPALGNIDSTGLYVAPSSIPAKQTLTVTAVNIADKRQVVRADVTLSPPIEVHVIPGIAVLGPSETRGFGALVVNATWPDVIWNLPKGTPGTIDVYGHYTAPGSILSAQTVTIQAISAMDGKTIGSATVTLRPPAYPLTVNISPIGGGTVTPAAGSSHAVGTTVTLNATPSAGYSFAGWNGSPDLAGATANPAAIMMKSGAAVTANFTALPTKLKLSDDGKSGASNARVWRFKLSNSGPGAANAAQLTRVTLSQSNGAVCNPVIQGPFPQTLGNMAPASSVTVVVRVDFSSCTAARFTMTAELSANGGMASLSVSRRNQEP